MLNVIDGAILSLHQGFSEWSQLTFDRHCYWWSYILGNVSGIMALVIAYLSWENPAAPAGRFYMLIFLALVELLGTPMRRRKAKATMPILSPFLETSFAKFFSISFFVMGIHAAIAFTYDFMWVLFITWGCMHYFDRCKPLPPGFHRKKVSKTAHSVA